MKRKTLAAQPVEVWAGLAGFAVVLLYSVAGVLQTLVWNPQAAVPGETLGQIHAEMAKAHESLSVPWVIAWGLIGFLLAVGILFQGLRRKIPAGRAALLNLVLIMLAAPSHWFASIPASMGLADTFYISGGDHSPWGAVLYLVSAAALGVLMLLLIGKWNRAGG